MKSEVSFCRGLPRQLRGTLASMEGFDWAMGQPEPQDAMGARPVHRTQVKLQHCVASELQAG